jgi:hypothetical protein
VNGKLCYCSGKKKRGSTREDRPVVSEEIEKDAIKGYLICVSNYSTYPVVIREKMFMYKIVSNKIARPRETILIHIYLNL